MSDEALFEIAMPIRHDVLDAVARSDARPHDAPPRRLGGIESVVKEGVPPVETP